MGAPDLGATAVVGAAGGPEDTGELEPVAAEGSRRGRRGWAYAAVVTLVLAGAAAALAFAGGHGSGTDPSLGPAVARKHHASPSASPSVRRRTVVRR